MRLFLEISCVFPLLAVKLIIFCVLYTVHEVGFESTLVLGVVRFVRIAREVRI